MAKPQMIQVPISEYGDMMSLNVTALGNIPAKAKRKIEIEIAEDLIYEGKDGTIYLNLSIQPSDQDFAKASIKPQWSKEVRAQIKSAVESGKAQWSTFLPFVGNVKRSKFEQENAASSAPAPTSNFAPVEDSEDLPF